MPPLPGQEAPPAPGMPPPPPPTMAPPPGNTGPGIAPGGNMGNMAAAKLDIGNGVKMLLRALPNIPMGSPLHTDILTTVQKISKHMGEEQGGDDGLHANSMMQMLRQQQQRAPQIAAMRAMGAPSGAPALPAPPTPPPPQAE